jgi:type VI secretion system protein VasG
MGLNLKNMVGKLTPQARRALEGAAGLCQSRSHYEVAGEHWLVKLAEQPTHDIARICEHYEIAPEAALRGLERGLDDYKTGNSGRPALGPEVEELLQSGWLRASIDYQHSRLRSGVLFLAALADRTMGRRLRESFPEFERINVEDLALKFSEIVAGCPEDREVFHQAGGATAVAGKARAGGAAAGPATPALDQFTVDMTEEAKEGRMDPILGRDREIRQIVDILTRRRQNNPILTGEAGVGKTAVVEGFAQRVAAGDVPEPLRGVMVKSLDLGLLQAGAGVKGEFENRLKQVIEEVHASPVPIILFIDEAHTLIGAGGQAGQNDAANLLKPALARGGLRTIAATTWAEYKKYFEKDPALTRRFQVVKIDEPDEAAADRDDAQPGAQAGEAPRRAPAGRGRLRLGAPLAALPAGPAVARQVGQRARHRLRPRGDRPGGHRPRASRTAAAASTRWTPRRPCSSARPPWAPTAPRAWPRSPASARPSPPSWPRSRSAGRRRRRWSRRSANSG